MIFSSSFVTIQYKANEREGGPKCALESSREEDSTACGLSSISVPWTSHAKQDFISNKMLNGSLLLTDFQSSRLREDPKYLF